MKSILLCTLNAKYIHTSLALRYLKAYCLQDADLKIELKEYTINELLPDVMASIYSFQPDILCFSCYIWNIRSILELCHDYKKVAPQTIIILGGPEVSYDSLALLKENPAIDFIVRGEGEVSLKELLIALDNNQPVNNVRGITCRQGAELNYHPDQPLIEDLDNIPFPYPADLREYKDKIVYYESSRGCPFNCAYCLSSTQRQVRFFSLERVKKDLTILLTQEVREVKFVDRTFNCNENRAREIIKFLADQEAISKFHFELDAALISDQMLEFLKNLPADRFNFEIGVQSTYPAALQAVQRTSSWERLSRNVQQLNSSGNIHLHLDLIAGLPYEGYAEFAQSFNNAYALNPDVLQLGFLKLLKGSRLRDEAQQYGYVFQEQPPYQILANNYISYDQMIKLKQIEELLEKYYNSGDMSRSVAYIINYVYDEDAFAFFEGLAFYWERNQLFAVAHKKERLYSILIDFIRGYHSPHLDVVNDLLKFDFLNKNRTDVLPAGLWSHNPAHIKEEIYACIKDKEFIKKHLPGNLPASPREIKKNLHLEYFHWDPNQVLPDSEEVKIMFVYDPIKKLAVKKIRL
ncbi:Elongator protein 3/MiaB/NifB [Syntrophomonas zehnderi OL-4]|uniref:Elongator protein 3/MiaB/NifB n=1 Tax=Syntrophomonas zehnderi OL-4 TaxID=690567 RepID=A0A0E4C8H1_9FIRM|nr:B12-binding domain-containing radical SAM protein [Syntrophomonas zehnderi]CFX44546.1 Elongator protein 3/MiaB/NifB [Syntrophomonas zehnderi OL-4]